MGLTPTFFLILLAIAVVILAIIAGIIVLTWFAAGTPDRWRVAVAEAGAQRAERDAEGLA